MSLKVMSQNVMCWGVEGKSTLEMRRPLLKRAVLDSGADIIGFQEVIPAWKAFFDEDFAGFESYLIYRSEKNQEGTPIYWNPKRVNMLECGHFWLSETPEISSFGWDAACVRITCWALFENKEDGRKFAFVNTHLDHKGMSAQVNGIRQIRAFINDKFGRDLPLILTGDFNATPDSQTIKVANEMLIDSRKAARDTTSDPTFHGFGKNGSDTTKKLPITIDYIYLTPNIGCEKFEVVKLEESGVVQSDHYGILSTINI